MAVSERLTQGVVKESSKPNRRPPVETTIEINHAPLEACSLNVAEVRLDILNLFEIFFSAIVRIYFLGLSGASELISLVE